MDMGMRLTLPSSRTTRSATHSARRGRGRCSANALRRLASFGEVGGRWLISLTLNFLIRYRRHCLQSCLLLQLPHCNTVLVIQPLVEGLWLYTTVNCSLMHAVFDH